MINQSNNQPTILSSYKAFIFYKDYNSSDLTIICRKLKGYAAVKDKVKGENNKMFKQAAFDCCLFHCHQKMNLYEMFPKIFSAITSFRVPCSCVHYFGLQTQTWCSWKCHSTPSPSASILQTIQQPFSFYLVCVHSSAVSCALLVSSELSAPIQSVILLTASQQQYIRICRSSLRKDLRKT